MQLAAVTQRNPQKQHHKTQTTKMSLQAKKTTTTITTKLQRWGHSSPHSID
jgi:hypothetical protein